MRRALQLGARTILVSFIALMVLSVGVIAAQDRGRRQPPDRASQGARERRPPAVRHVPAPTHRHLVFIGGYFYDPFYGPYPWWIRDRYPFPYFPIYYERRADIRLLVTPRTAAVYVDGFYAGVVDDFDGIFQGLPLPPGGHSIELYLEGFHTIRRSVYLAQGSTFKLRETLRPLAPGERSEPPMLAPPLPAPPEGSYLSPITPPRVPPPQSEQPQAGKSEEQMGTLRLQVKPATADVTIDGEPWLTADPGHFVIDLSVGHHRIDVAQPNHAPASQEVDVDAGKTTSLTISLRPLP
jgi:hypothetical protein